MHQYFASFQNITRQLSKKKCKQKERTKLCNSFRKISLINFRVVAESEKKRSVRDNENCKATISVVSAATAAATGNGVVSSRVGGEAAAPTPPAAGHAARGRASSSGTPDCRPHSGTLVG
jgi:hypothetical protein